MEGLDIKKIVAAAVTRIEEQEGVEISYRITRKDAKETDDREATA